MDEVVFRAQQAMETLQVRLTMAAENGIRIVRQASDETRSMALRAMQDPSFDGFRDSARNFWSHVLEAVQRVRLAAVEFTDPAFFAEQLQLFFRDEISRNNAFFICVGLGFGTTGGFLLGLWMARPHLTAPVMKSIACISFIEPDNVTLCKTVVPQLCSSSDILVRVRAVSIHRLDERISSGYGRNLRCMIQRYNKRDHVELPLVLGRACAGVIEAVGKGSKSGLEIGDEVWLASPWYESGLASELVVAPESRIGRKPFIIGFEGAASLPYSGCVALSALRTAGLNEHTCAGKRILVQDGCSPVGCVLTQLIKKWGASVTATCFIRSVPVIKALGADDVIALNPEDYKQDVIEDSDIIEKFNFSQELSTREPYDVIFLTTKINYNIEFLEKFLLPDGKMVDTVDPDLASDEFGIIMKYFYSIFIGLKKLQAFIFRSGPDWGGPHLCHLALDRLAGYVNDGILQTVVDQVYTPQDAERAITHICSEKAIGSTIITFRS